MRRQIEDLRNGMREECMDVFYSTASDPHCSEYVNDHYKNTEYLSGLHSENETLIVTEDAAYIWTDGRYFLQAERELAGSGIELMKMGEEGVPTALEFLRTLAEKADAERDFVIGFDGNCVPATFDADLSKTFGELRNVVFKWDKDLTEWFWKERPEIEPSEIWKFPLSSAGRTSEEKLSDMREAMKAKGADYLILSDLMETAWLTNLRGADVECTPVFFSYALISQDKAVLYVMDGALSEELASEMGSFEVKSYDAIFDDVRMIPENAKVWMDLSTASYLLYKGLPARENVINEMTPAALAKTVKNETEIRSTINAHIKDGVAVTRFIKWIKDVAASEPQTEISAVP